MKKSFFVFWLIAMAVLSSCAKPPPIEPQTDEWKTIRNSDVAKVSSEWKTPVWANINSDGWEDGAYISSDGNTLYFVYINVDLFKLPNIAKTGPDRDTSKICKPSCGQYPRIDLFYSTKDASGKWQTPKPHSLTINYPIGGIVFSNENKAYFMMEKDDGLKTEIYFAEKMNNKWRNPQKISALSSAYTDDDPYINPEDDKLFFWSADRPSKFVGYNIYFSEKVNGEWQAPIILPEPINSNSNDMQPFLFGNTLYFTSDREGKPKIYKSVMQGNKWSTPEIVVESKNGVGEPSLTSDGKFLYFIQIFKSDNAYNPEIMYAEKR